MNRNLDCTTTYDTIFSMIKKKKSKGGIDLSNRDLLEILMQEIADVRNELKEDISGLRNELKTEIQSCNVNIKDVQKEVRSFRMESHQNQVAFIKNIQDQDRRITVLER